MRYISAWVTTNPLKFRSFGGVQFKLYLHGNDADAIMFVWNLLNCLRMLAHESEPTKWTLKSSFDSLWIILVRILVSVIKLTMMYVILSFYFQVYILDYNMYKKWCLLENVSSVVYGGLRMLLWVLAHSVHESDYLSLLKSFFVKIRVIQFAE